MTAISSRERRSRPLLLSRYPPKIIQSVVQFVNSSQPGVGECIKSGKSLNMLNQSSLERVTHWLFSKFHSLNASCKQNSQLIPKLGKEITKLQSINCWRSWLAICSVLRGYIISLRFQIRTGIVNQWNRCRRFDRFLFSQIAVLVLVAVRYSLL